MRRHTGDGTDFEWFERSQCPPSKFALPQGKWRLNGNMRLRVKSPTYQACRASPFTPPHNRFKHDTAGEIQLCHHTSSAPSGRGPNNARSAMRNSLLP